MAYRGKIRFNQNFNVNRVVKRLVRTVLALYVGGTIMTVFGTVMANTTSPFYTGLSLIGWTVGTNAQTNGTANCFIGCGNTAVSGCNATTVTQTAASNCITATSGSGVLAVVGIIAIAQIVTEFVTW